MSENITLNNVATFQNDTTAVTTINSNNAVITTAFLDVLSRSGVTPNQMTSTLDMNGNQIVNLPPPQTVNSPARLIDVTTPGLITVNTATTGTSGHTVPFLDGANTWSNTQTITIPSGTLGGLVINQTPSGTVGGATNWNTVNISPDVVDAGVNFVSGFGMVHGFGSSTAKGGRIGLDVVLSLNAATNAANGNRFYTGAQFTGQAQTTDGGSPGSEKGQLYGLNPVVRLTGSAASFVSCISMEADVQMETGTSVLDKYGILIAQTGSDAVAGSRNDAALLFGNQTSAVNWGTLIQIGTNLAGQQNPLKTTGSILAIKGNPTFANGINLTGASSITGFAFSSPGFSVSGSNGSINTGLAGFASGTINFSGSTSGTASLSINNISNNFTLSQALSIGTVGSVAGSVALAGATSGSVTLSCSATGSVLQTTNNFSTTGTLNSGGVGASTGTIVLTGSTSGSATIQTPAVSAGLVQFASAGSFSANAAVATVLGSVGPTGSHTAVQKWLTIVDNAGITGYIPVF